MRNNLLLLIIFVLTGCFSDTEDNREKVGTEFLVAPEENTNTRNVTLSGIDNEDDGEKEPHARILDLTLPEKISFEDSTIDAPYIERPNLFDTEKLFNQKKQEGNISVTLMPNLKPGEKLTDVPEIDGGSVEVKVKIE